MHKFSIRSKLKFSFFLLAFFIGIISILSIIFVNIIGNTTKDIYEHPYTVTNAIKDVEIAAFEEFSTLQVVLHPGEVTIEDLQLEIDDVHQRTLENFITLYGKYLGDIEDIRLVEIQYNKIHNIVLSAVAAKIADDHVTADGYRDQLSEVELEALIHEIQTVKIFAENKAIEFQNQANTIKVGYLIALVVVSGLLITLSLSMFRLMVKDIYPPISNLLNTIESFKRGEDVNTLDLTRHDEIGIVSASLNQMLDNIKTQNEIDSLNLKLSSLKDRENLRITLMSIGDGVITTDLNGIITNINPVASRLTGYDPIIAIGKDSKQIFHIINKESRRRVDNPINRVIKFGAIVGLANHTVLVSRTGEEFDISDSAAPIIDDKGKMFGVVLVFRDVTEEYQAQNEIKYLSYHDSLTGLFNRNHMEKKILELQESSARNVAILMGDVNGLKITNDAFGHDFGDLLLKEISQILEKSVPMDRTTIVRWGGDEFVLIVEDTSKKEVENISKTIIENCNNYDSESPVKPSISFGYAIRTGKDQNLYRTLIRAEDMMYENKLLEKDSLRSGIVASLQNSLFEKSYETEEHAERVGEYSRKIAEKLKLPENEINSVVLLSRLHDIGKISIDDEILLKPGKLNQVEWKEMKKHPETGYRIASSLNDLAHIAEGVLSHHEHYDGNGYPRGLKGKNIPLHARILSVADAFDVMRSDRSYKKAISTEKAIEELNRCRGTQFDPEIVDLFIAIIKE